jgi:hypothetical protein
MRSFFLAGAAAVALAIPLGTVKSETLIAVMGDGGNELQQLEALGAVRPSQVLVAEIQGGQGNAAFDDASVAAVRVAAGGNSAIATALRARNLTPNDVVALEVKGDRVIVVAYAPSADSPALAIDTVEPAAGPVMEEFCNDPAAAAAVSAGSTEAMAMYLAEIPPGPCAQFVLSALMLSGVEPAAGPAPTPPAGPDDPGAGRQGGEFHEPRDPSRGNPPLIVIPAEPFPEAALFGDPSEGPTDAPEAGSAPPSPPSNPLDAAKDMLCPAC